MSTTGWLAEYPVRGWSYDAFVADECLGLQQLSHRSSCLLCFPNRAAECTLLTVPLFGVACVKHVIVSLLLLLVCRIQPHPTPAITKTLDTAVLCACVLHSVTCYSFSLAVAAVCMYFITHLQCHDQDA